MSPLYAEGPDGRRFRFADTASFMAWFRSYPHSPGMIRAFPLSVISSPPAAASGVHLPAPDAAAGVPT